MSGRSHHPFVVLLDHFLHQRRVLLPGIMKKERIHRSEWKIIQKETGEALIRSKFLLMASCWSSNMILINSSRFVKRSIVSHNKSDCKLLKKSLSSPNWPECHSHTIIRFRTMSRVSEDLDFQISEISCNLSTSRFETENKEICRNIAEKRLYIKNTKIPASTPRRTSSDVPGPFSSVLADMLDFLVF